MSTQYQHCLLIPFLNRFEMLAELLENLLPSLPEKTIVLLVDDGSDEIAAESQRLKPYKQESKIRFLRHEINLGPAKARNSGVEWCRQQQIKTIILLDSDCIPEPDMVQQHLDLHNTHPDMLCIGGAIIGEGNGIWAHLDRTLSWFTSLPEQQEGEVNEPLHIPTTNLSFKLEALADLPELFEPRYKTGEDVAFIKAIRKMGGKIFFSPKPIIYHQDRESFKSVFSHQFRWALHTYIVRTGLENDSLLKRLGFMLFFLLGFPFYVFYATFLTLKPWFKVSRFYIFYIPVILLAYIIKGIGVLVGTIHPKLALY